MPKKGEDAKNHTNLIRYFYSALASEGGVRNKSGFFSNFLGPSDNPGCVVVQTFEARQLDQTLPRGQWWPNRLLLYIPPSYNSAAAAMTVVWSKIWHRTGHQCCIIVYLYSVCHCACRGQQQSRITLPHEITCCANFAYPHRALHTLGYTTYTSGLWSLLLAFQLLTIWISAAVEKNKLLANLMFFEYNLREQSSPLITRLACPFWRGLQCGGRRDYLLLLLPLSLPLPFLAISSSTTRHIFPPRDLLLSRKKRELRRSASAYEAPKAADASLLRHTSMRTR